MREGKDDEANKLIEESGLMPSDSVLESMYKPRNLRTFEQLNGQLKAEFMDKLNYQLNQ